MSWSTVWVSWSHEWMNRFYHVLYNWQLSNTTNITNVNVTMDKTLPSSREWFVKPMLVLIILLLLRQLFKGKHTVYVQSSEILMY